jgi:hypothetical protein
MKGQRAYVVHSQNGKIPRHERRNKCSCSRHFVTSLAVTWAASQLAFFGMWHCAGGHLASLSHAEFPRFIPPPSTAFSSVQLGTAALSRLRNHIKHLVKHARIKICARPPASVAVVEYREPACSISYNHHEHFSQMLK